MNLWIVTESWRCSRITKVVRALTAADARTIAFRGSIHEVEVEPLVDTGAEGVLWTREEDWDVD